MHQSGSKTTRWPRALNATLRSLEPKASWQNCHLCLISLPRNAYRQPYMYITNDTQEY